MKTSVTHYPRSLRCPALAPMGDRSRRLKRSAGSRGTGRSGGWRWGGARAGAGSREPNPRARNSTAGPQQPTLHLLTPPGLGYRIDGTGWSEHSRPLDAEDEVRTDHHRRPGAGPARCAMNVAVAHDDRGATRAVAPVVGRHRATHGVLGALD